MPVKVTRAGFESYWVNRHRRQRRLAREAASGVLRTVPDTADSFYVVVPSDLDVGEYDAIHLQRGIGGGGVTDLGVKWPEWRVTGRSRLSGADGDVDTPVAVFTDDVGAQDLVANNGSVYMGSFHGLGAAGALNSETLDMDGEAFDPTVATTGAVLTIRNSTTASDGTNSLTRDMTTVIGDDGAVRYRINSHSVVGSLPLVYLGMLIGTGSFNRADILEAGSEAWHVGPELSLSQIVAGRVLPNAVSTGIRLVDLADGRAVSIKGSAIANLANYTQGELLRDNSSADRLKAYFGRFSSAAAIDGAEWETNAQILDENPSWADSNLFTNGDFATGDLTGWTKQTGATLPTIVSGAMRQVREAAANHRMRQTASFAAALTDVWAYRVDRLSLSGGTAPTVRVSTSTALSFVGAMVDRQLTADAQWVFYFKPTVTPIYAGIEHSLGASAETLDTDNYWLSNLNGAEGVRGASPGAALLAWDDADGVEQYIQWDNSAGLPQYLEWDID